jgi:enoyl-CoA hydratase/carnithine racemase
MNNRPPAAEQTTTEQATTGQATTEHTAAGQMATGQMAIGQMATGQTPTGRTAAGQPATGQTATGQTANRQTATDLTATGQTADRLTADGHTADGQVLQRRDADGVAWLTLNRPAARNALSMELMAALDAELTALADNKAVKVVVIGGAGPAFCAGHDLREIRANPARDAYEAVFALCSRLMQRIVHLPQPVIARVHGVASAAGCQLVATCDLAVAADTARFATPGVDIGLFCSTPMVALSRAVHRKAAMEMLLTGEMADAARARELGLINRVVPEAELDTAVAALAARIAGKSPLTVAIGKEAFYRQAEMDLATAYDYAAGVMTRNMLARDAAEGIDAFLQKRAPHWSGS